MIIIEDKESYLELNDDFTWYVRSVNYDWKNSIVNIECIFQEGVYKHSRTFQYAAKDGMTEKDIISLISNEHWSKKGVQID